jgi:hypothetical protein
VILYRDLKHAERVTPPPWLDGAANLQARDDTKSGRLWGIGDAFLLEPAERGWSDLEDGWQVRVAGKVNAMDLARDQKWCAVMPVTSLEDVIWMAPRVLDITGERAFRVAYGADFFPELSPDQKRAYAIAEEARVLLAQGAREGGFSASLGARYAADLLSVVNHITPAAIARLRLMDDAVILGVLRTAAGFVGELESAT